LKTAYLALGSNLGDRRANLAGARERLVSADLHVVRASSIYETAPRDLLNQPWFLNQVVEAETGLFPRQLLAFAQKIERELGRKRAQPKGPRVIDIDILLFGEAIIHTPDLEVPHPRMLERRFVLEPLAELAPDLRHPATGRSMRESIAAVMDQVVKRLDPLST
jgi:2-amino-4-hydroxy-6-hydroxymethyldihydropteridine diphosphokinase